MDGMIQDRVDAFFESICQAGVYNNHLIIREINIVTGRRALEPKCGYTMPDVAYPSIKTSIETGIATMTPT
jgi:hypothetical protein